MIPLASLPSELCTDLLKMGLRECLSKHQLPSKSAHSVRTGHQAGHQAVGSWADMAGTYHSRFGL